MDFFVCFFVVRMLHVWSSARGSAPAECALCIHGKWYSSIYINGQSFQHQMVIHRCWIGKYLADSLDLMANSQMGCDSVCFKMTIYVELEKIEGRISMHIHSTFAFATIRRWMFPVSGSRNILRRTVRWTAHIYIYYIEDVPALRVGEIEMPHKNMDESLEWAVNICWCR